MINGFENVIDVKRIGEGKREVYIHPLFCNIE